MLLFSNLVKKIYLALGVVVIVILISYFFLSAKPTVVAFGDSLTEGVGSELGGGFVSMLSLDLGMPITNLGESGDTTGKALARINDVLLKKPTLTIVLLGGNDALQKVPEENTIANLQKIIETLQASGSKVLLLGLETNANNAHDRALFQSLADEYHTLYIPNILSGITGHESFMSDPLHPNDLGYRLMAHKVKPVLEKAL